MVKKLAETKRCSKCQEPGEAPKPASEFFRTKTTGALSAYCRPCTLKYNREAKAARAKRDTVERPATKWCGGCEAELDASLFYENKRNANGLSTRCQECTKKENAPRNAKYREAHRKEKRADNLAYYYANKSTVVPKMTAANKRRRYLDPVKYYSGVRAQRMTLRERVFEKLGHVCATCGYSDKRALQFDHVHGGGNAHRKRRTDILRDILKAPDGMFRTLCANHNWKLRPRLIRTETSIVNQNILKRRDAVVAMLGGKCKHCGCDDLDILHIDHINSGGGKEYRELGRSKQLTRMANVGAAEYQLLCPNCNAVKSATTPAERHIKHK